MPTRARTSVIATFAVVATLTATACADDILVPCTLEGTVVMQDASATLRVGEMTRARAMVRTCGGRIYELREYWYWSSDPTIAAVDSATGWIYAWRPGRVTINAQEPRSPVPSGFHELTVTR
ncbi:MAG: hypothetical protein LCH84_07445 [Gemmatimonadetes bacterium]|nr:hypothetical protein [Gemmatimonadota bacterium]